jgi:hypothetical protein
VGTVVGVARLVGEAVGSGREDRGNAWSAFVRVHYLHVCAAQLGLACVVLVTTTGLAHACSWRRQRGYRVVVDTSAGTQATETAGAAETSQATETAGAAETSQATETAGAAGNPAPGTDPPQTRCGWDDVRIAELRAAARSPLPPPSAQRPGGCARARRACGCRSLTPLPAAPVDAVVGVDGDAEWDLCWARAQRVAVLSLSLAVAVVWVATVASFA